MRRILVFTVLVVSFVSSCTYNSIEDLDPSRCDTTGVTYSGYVEPLISESCAYAGCHLGNFAAAQLDLSEYDQVKSVVDNGKLQDRINRAAGDPLLMPSTGKLAPCQITKIEAWIEAGAQEN